MVKRVLFKVFLLLLGFQITNSTVFKNELSLIMRTNSIKSNENLDSVNFTFKEVSELKLLMTGLIRLYQLFISSQDMPVCNFTKTCSRFGMEAIQKYGVFFGILITADRLQRCNGIGIEYYPIDLETGRAIDYPVETYYLKKQIKK